MRGIIPDVPFPIPSETTALPAPARPTPLLFTPERLPEPIPPREAPDLTATSRLAMEDFDRVMPEMAKPRPVLEPSLGDYRGEPISDPMAFRRDQFIREKQKLDEQGNFAGVKRNWKDILLATLAGGAEAVNANPNDPNMLARFLGGAATGGVGTTISPTTGREYLFRTTQEPRLVADQQRRSQQEQEEAERRARAARTGMLEEEWKDFPDEMRARRAERAARADEYKARAEERRRPKPPPQPRARTRYIDAEGFLRDGETDELVRDPATKQPLKGAPRFAETKPPGAISTREGIWNPVTKSWDVKFDPKEAAEKGIPAQAATAANRVTELKANADGAWAAWRGFQKNPDKTDAQNAYDNEQLKIAAQRAQTQYNSAAKALGQTHGRYFETGEDPAGSGWNYVKGIPQAQGSSGGQPVPQRAAPQGGGRPVSRATVQKYADRYNLSFADAQKAFENDGLKVQQ